MVARTNVFNAGNGFRGGARGNQAQNIGYMNVPIVLLLFFVNGGHQIKGSGCRLCFPLGFNGSKFRFLVF